MTFLEKFTAATFGTIAIVLILTNPTGDKAVADGFVNIYKGVVGAFIKPK